MTVTAESFAKDVAKHQLTVHHDAGVYRHLHVGDPKTFNMSYQITTWPGHLAYSGDMGSFVFTRVNDMFDFFRGDRINPQYWAEKLKAIDRCDGMEEYSPKLARDYINEQLDAYEAKTDVRQAAAEIDEESGEDELRRQLGNFSAHDSIFADSWEADFKDYTFRFLWCCHALVHGIKLYDEAKREQQQETPPHPERFYLLSLSKSQPQHNMLTWWRLKSAGYCWDLASAQLYSEEEARKTERDSGGTERAIPEALARSLTSTVVEECHLQKLRITPAEWRKARQ